MITSRFSNLLPIILVKHTWRKKIVSHNRAKKKHCEKRFLLQELPVNYKKIAHFWICTLLTFFSLCCARWQKYSKIGVEPFEERTELNVQCSNICVTDQEVFRQQRTVSWIGNSGWGEKEAEVWAQANRLDHRTDAAVGNPTIRVRRVTRSSCGIFFYCLQWTADFRHQETWWGLQQKEQNILEITERNSKK